MDNIEILKDNVEPNVGTGTSKGFGLFLVELESMLTLANIRRLATVLNFPPGQIDEIERHPSAGYVFIKYLREKGIISQTSISCLINCLEVIKLYGVAEIVANKYKENVTEGTSPPHDTTAKMEESDIKSDQSLAKSSKNTSSSRSKTVLQSDTGVEFTKKTSDIGIKKSPFVQDGTYLRIEAEQKADPPMVSTEETVSLPDTPKESKKPNFSHIAATNDAENVDCPANISEPFKEFLLRLGLEKGMHDKYSIRDSQQLKLGLLDASEERTVFDDFISRITSYDYRVHQVKCPLHKQGDVNFDSVVIWDNESDDEDWYKDVKGEESASDTIPIFSARDILFAIFNCLDPFLLQEILMKLSACQLAVPLLMPDCMGNVALNLWGLRKVSKSWYDSCDNIIQTEIVVNHPFPAVTAMRIGEISISKSNILNKLLGPAQSNDDHAYFLSQEQDPHLAYWSKGTLECVWFLPNLDVDSENITTAFSLLNLRGDSSLFRPQVKFATRNSFATIVFCDSANITEINKAFINEIKSQSHVILVISQQKRVRQKPLLKSSITIIHTDGYNALEVSKLISSVLIGLFKREKHTNHFCIENSVSSCDELSITVDEAKTTCKQAQKAAKNICDLIGQEFPNINKNNIFVLQKYWKDWAELDKNKRWVFKTVDIEHEIEKIKSNKKALRELQSQEIPSAIMFNFFEYCSLPTESRLFFIGYLEYYLNAMSNATFKPLLKDLQTHSTERRKISLKIRQETTLKENTLVNDVKKLKNTEQDITNKERDCIKKIDENSFGLEYFIREIAQITECHFYTNTNMKQYGLDIKRFSSFAVDLLLNGYPIEIMDGEANHVPLHWVQQVFKTLSKRCGEDAKVYVISVLGIQSSGKSTLLNSMFGVQFAVRAGRCTKGAFIQLVSVHKTLQKHIGCSFIVIIDTEGLGAPEKSPNISPEHDNELATFALCNSDLTLINIGGQTMGEEMTNVLQIAAHAFIRMKEVNLKVECRVIQQFVADVTAEDRNEAAMENIMIRLDNAIAIAAKEEGKDHLYRQFSDVFSVQNYENDSNNVQCIPSLWRGFMSTPDHHYSTRVQQLKQSIIRAIKLKDNTLSIMDFSQRITDVWNAIKKENFVFSFQNTKEITLYEELMKIYKAWVSPVRVKVMERELQARQNIENSKTDRIQYIYEESIKQIELLLADECEGVKQNLSSCLNNQKYKEIKRYAMSFYSDLITFKTQMINSVSMEISQFVTLCLKTRNKAPEKESLSASLHAKVALLAAEIRQQINEQLDDNRTTQSDTDTFITNKFKIFWQKWMDDTDKKYPVETLGQISYDIEQKVKQCIIHEIQNKTLASNVLHYIQDQSITNYSISSSNITNSSDIERAKAIFSTVDETASNQFNNLIAKIKTYAENNEKFADNVVELLQEIKTFIKQCDLMFDEATAICFFYSVFLRLLQDKQVDKEFLSILQNFDSVSAISEEQKIFLEWEIEETLQGLMTSNLHVHQSTEKQRKRDKKSQKHSQTLETENEEFEIHTDKNKTSFSDVLSSIGKRFGNWGSTPWTQALEEFVDNAIDMTKKKFKVNINTAVALNHFCNLTVKYCCAYVAPDNLDDAIKFSCEFGIQKFKESGEQFLKRYIDSDEYIMKFTEPLNYPNIPSKIQFALSVIEDAKVTDSEVIKKELIEDMVPKYGCSTFSFLLFQHLDRQYIRFLPVRRQEVLRSVHERVASVKKTFLAEETYRAPFNTLAVSKVLSDLINNRDSDIFPNELLGPTIVHIGAWIIPLGAVAQHEFERSKNPAVMLRKEKDLFLSQFKSLCSEKYDEMIAKTFVDVIMKTAKGSLKYKVYPELAREFLVQNDIFKVKRCFIGTVLENICERDSYQDVVAFLQDFDAYSQQWILQYIVKKCNQKEDSLLKTTVDKCIVDIKNAALFSVVKADEKLDNTNPLLSEWLNIFSDTMSKKISITCKETDIDKLNTYLKVSKMKVFSGECSKLLQNLDEMLRKTIELPTPGHFEQTKQWLLNELPKQIHLELFESFKGCSEQCPFCGAVCEETLSGHAKHVVNLHFPKGVNGKYWLKTNKLVTEMCTSSVESDILYKTPSWVENPSYRPYKQYTVDYGNWYIQGIQDDKPIEYWQYIFATFNEKFAERYGLKKTDIPAAWTRITKQAALQCVKAAYQLD